MTAERLRQAAAKLRDVMSWAEDGNPALWRARPSGVPGSSYVVDRDDGTHASVVASGPDYAAEYIATMHPPVALALADWLDAEAARYMSFDTGALIFASVQHAYRDGHFQESLAVADAILGEA